MFITSTPAHDVTHWHTPPNVILGRGFFYNTLIARATTRLGSGRRGNGTARHDRRALLVLECLLVENGRRCVTEDGPVIVDTGLGVQRLNHMGHILVVAETGE